jgi:hypothetical protein
MGIVCGVRQLAAHHASCFVGCYGSFVCSLAHLSGDRIRFVVLLLPAFSLRAAGDRE